MPKRKLEMEPMEVDENDVSTYVCSSSVSEYNNFPEPIVGA